jgi:hypothetical protein
MKAEAATQASVSQAPTKGSCPMCGTLRDFQWKPAAVVQPQAALHLCNFQTWALARSRGSLELSTPGESLSSVFLERLKRSPAAGASSEDCALCHRVREEEVTRLRELAQQIQRPVFVQWMKTQGSLCQDHAGKLKKFAPLRLRTFHRRSRGTESLGAL